LQQLPRCKAAPFLPFLNVIWSRSLRKVSNQLTNLQAAATRQEGELRLEIQAPAEMVAKQARRLEQQEILNRLASMEQALAESWRRSQEQYNEDREQFLGIIKSKLEVGGLRAQRGANTSSDGGLGNRSRPAS
jgi:hypothetical protein